MRILMLIILAVLTGLVFFLASGPSHGQEPVSQTWLSD